MRVAERETNAAYRKLKTLFIFRKNGTEIKCGLTNPSRNKLNYQTSVKCESLHIRLNLKDIERYDRRHSRGQGLQGNFVDDNLRFAALNLFNVSEKTVSRYCVK